MFHYLVAIAFGNVALARWKGVIVGERCRIYIREFGTEPFLIKIGDRVTITQGCILLTHDGSTWLIRDNNGVRHQKYSDITLGDDVFLGANSIVMPGVRIGNKVIVGAGSVVTKNIPDNTVVAGNPAREICSFEDYRSRITQCCPKDTDLLGKRSYKERVIAARDWEVEKRRENGTGDF